MSVSSTNNVVILNADGSTHSFTFNFKIFAASDLKVIVRSSAGVETDQTLNSQYIIPDSSVDNASGGNILFKFNTGTSSDAHFSSTDFRPANGSKVILRQNIPLTQTLDLVNNDPFDAETLESSLDRIVLQVQSVKEAVDRSFKFSRSNLLDSSGSQIGSTYPEIEEDTTARANKVLSFDSTGTPIATQEIGTLRGNWAADTAYQERDIVKDTSTSDHFIVNAAHTSSGSQPLTTNANSAKYTAITNFASSIITGTITASAINTTTSGTDNLIAGQNAGDSIASGGNYNVLLGHDAGTAITTGDYNVAVGNEALKTETNTNMTVAVGHKALAAQLNTSSDNNVFNTAVGARAGEAVTTGSVNTLIGGVAGKSLTGGGNNVAIGYGALQNEQLTNLNTAVGHETLYSLRLTSSEASAVSFAANNTALGNRAGYSLSNGTYNTFLGVTAGYNITSGSKNTVVGGFDGNEGGLDIRTSSNYIVLSDGDGNPRLYMTNTGTAHFASTVTATGFTIGNAAINENDLEAIDDITAGIVSASKAAIVDTNKDITGFRNVTLTGELDAGSLDISGDADIAGTTNLDDTDIDGTLVVDGSNISLDSTSTLNIDNSNTSNGITIGTATSGVPVSIGHSTSEVTINDNLNVTGDLTVNGTTTTVNSTVTTVVDPILTIGSNSTDDNKDRGLEFKYNDGSARVGFFGYDDSASAFTVFTAATNSSEVFSGTTGNAIFNQVTGTLQTAAQTNITSVGTLSSLTVSGLVTADGGIDVDDFHIDGTAISLSAGNLSIDAGDNILLNTKQSSGSGGAVYLKQGGTNYGGLLNSSGELVIQSGSTPTTAVTFAGANATFAGTLATSGNITINTGSSGLPAINLSHSNANADNFQITAGTPGVANSGFTIRDVDASANRLVIDASGNATFDGAVNIGTTGSLSNNSGTFLIDANTNLTFRGGVQTFDNADGSVEYMRIDSNGNLGINGNPISYANGQATLFIEDTTNPAIAISDTGQSKDYFIVANGSRLGIVYGDGSNSSSASNITEIASFNNSGNVGIGTDSPQFKLHVNKGSSNYAPSNGVDENIVGFQTSYDSGGSQIVTFSNLDGNWVDGTSGADSAFGWLWGYQNLVRGGLIYDHRGTERMQMFSSYGTISFITPDSVDGDAVPTDSNMTERLVIAPGGDVSIGKTAVDTNAVGTDLYSYGLAVFVRNNGVVGLFNRLGSDGDVVSLRQASSEEGTISVSGSTVSYNGFSGLHESSGIASNIPVGTVCSTIDELDVYPDSQPDEKGSTEDHPKKGQTRADHAKIKVSDTEGDKRVYGVLQRYDNNDKPLVASVGIGSIRVTGACEGGDLLESNGDGTAKVQSDDIIRSKTIGKVTIGNSDTGVKLVSCVLYCG